MAEARTPVQPALEAEADNYYNDSSLGDDPATSSNHFNQFLYLEIQGREW